METIFSSIKERVLQIAEYKGIAKEKFFQDLGVTYGNFKGEAKKKALSSDTLATIVSIYPDVDIEWLITGKGKIFKEDIRPITVNEQGVPYEIKTPTGIPLVSPQTIIGFGGNNFVIKDDDIQARYVIPDFNGIDFMFRVEGSSMYPKYSSGDIVACRIINESKFIQWNKTYIITTVNQGILCKRLRISDKKKHIKAISDNKEYPPFDIPQDEITSIALIIGAIHFE